MSPRIYQNILKDSFNKWQEIHCMKMGHDDVEFLFLNCEPLLCGTLKKGGGGCQERHKSPKSQTRPTS